jgi:hypothetical protein
VRGPKLPSANFGFCLPYAYRGKAAALAIAGNRSYLIDFIGAATVTRTPDPLITNEVLYQLSYCGLL